ncbi:MAG: SAM-dependent methyltransferase, partial [Frankia sp.]
AMALLDFGQPVALTCLMTLQFLDDDEVFGVVERYRAALPAGSYLALSAPTGDFIDPEAADALMASYRASGLSLWLRSRDQFAAYFDGLDVVPPGITPMAEWRAEHEALPRPTPEQAGGYGAIGRKRAGQAGSPAPARRS